MSGILEQQFGLATARDGTRVEFGVFPGTGPPFLVIRTPGTNPMRLRNTRKGAAEGFERFRRGRPGVFFDWRGSGESDPIDGTLTLDDLVDDLDAVTSEIGKPVDALVMGRACFAASLHVSEHPERYRSLNLEGCMLRPDQGWQGIYNRPGWEGHYSEHLQGIARRYQGTSPADAAAFALRWEQGVPAASFAAYVESERGFDLTEVLPGIEQPVWVTARLPVDYGPAGDLAALLPNSILTIYEPPTAAGRGGFDRDEWDNHLGARLGDPPSVDQGSGAANESRTGSVELSPREVEVLSLVAAGDSNRAISSALEIAEGTVKRHVSNILAKTGLENRRQLMRFADAQGIGESSDG